MRVTSFAFDGANNVYYGDSDGYVHKITFPPTATITASSSSLVSGDTATITFTLSAASTDFTAGDVSVTGGTLSNFSGSGTSYTATFTPTATNAQGTASISVGDGTFHDGSAQANTLTSASLSYDTRPPQFVSAAIASGSTEIDLTYNHPLDASHVAATGAFTVTAGGQTIAVTGVTVQGSVVKLTLASAVSSASSVTVAYADPTTGDDISAIQNSTGQDVASMSATITDAAPVITVTGSAMAYTEQAAAAPIRLTGITITDADDTQITGATVSITAGLTSGDTLAFATQNGISGSYNASSGVMTLTGTASLANYQTALQSVTFSNTTSDGPTAISATRTISWAVTDAGMGGKLAGKTSVAATSGITITPINDGPPVVDASKSPQLNDTLASATAPTNGTLPTGATLVSSIIASPNNMTDPDSDPLGIAVTAVNTSKGTLYYSLNGGTTWSAVGTVTAASAQVFYADANTYLYFVPSSKTLATITDAVTFRGWDRTNGSANGATGVVAQTAPTVAGTTTGAGDIAANVVLSADGNTAYVPSSANGLAVINISTPASPTLLGTITKYDVSSSGLFGTTNWTRGSTNDVAISGDYAYVANGVNGLQVMKLSTRATVSHLGLGGTSTGVAVATIGAKTYAYLANGTSGLQIVDVTSPTAPAKPSGGTSGLYDTPGTATGVAVGVFNGKTYAFVADGSIGLVILDVTTSPSAPTKVGSLAITGTAARVTLSGNTAYVADGSGGLVAVDISTLATPTLLGRLPAASVGTVNGFSLQGSTGYATDAAGNLRVVDLADPSNMKVMQTLSLGSGAMTGVALKGANGALGNYAVVAAGSAGVKLVNIGGGAFSTQSDTIAVTTVAGLMPSITSAAYNADSGVLTITGANLLNASTHDGDSIDPTQFTITGETSGSPAAFTFAGYQPVTASNNGTTISIQINAADRAAVMALLDKGGTTAATSGSFQLAASGDWDKSVSGEASQTGKTITVSGSPGVAISSSTAASYTERAAGVAINTTLSIIDLPGTNSITGAQVTISTGLTSGDSLNFTAQNNITGVYSASTGVLTLSGSDTVANYQTALRSVTFSNADNHDPTAIAATRTITWQVKSADSYGASAKSSINITAINEAPTLSATPTVASVSTPGTATALFSATSITNPEASQNIQTVAITTSIPPDGASEMIRVGNSLSDSVWVPLKSDSFVSLANGISVSTVSYSGVYCFVLNKADSAANWQSIINNLAYKNTASSPTAGTRSFSITEIDDHDGGYSTYLTTDIKAALTIAAAAPPTVTVPATMTITSITQTAVSGVSVTGTMSGAVINATVTALYGNIYVSNNTDTTRVGISGSGSRNVTIAADSIAHLNTILGGMTYQASSLLPITMSDTITIGVGNSASSSTTMGSQAGSGSIQVKYVRNDIPVLTLPVQPTITLAGANPISTLSVADTYYGTPLTARLAALHGSLGFTGSGVTPNTDGSVTVTAVSPTALNDILHTMTYTTNLTTSGSDRISVVVDDRNYNGIGGGWIKPGYFNLTVNCNDAPVVSVPGMQTITSTATAISGVSVTDAAIGSTVTATVSAGHGNLGFTDSTGASASGAGTGSVTITADDIAHLNTILGTMTYTSTASGSTSDSVTVSVNDNNGTALGGAKTSSKTFDILVKRSAAPVVTVPATQDITDTSAHTISGISIAADSTLTGITATVTATGGTLTGTGMSGGGTGTVSITGTRDQINTALTTLAFTSTNNAIANSITVSVDDGNSTAVGGAKTASGTIALNLVENDTPSIAGHAQVALADSSAHAITGITVTDSRGGSSYTATVSALHGTLDFTGAGITNNDTGSVTISAADPTALNTILSSMKYTAANTVTTTGDDTITVAVDDHGSAASLVGGDKTGQQTVGVVLVQNDTPVLSLPAPQTITLAGANAITGLSVADSYSGATLTATLSATNGSLGFTGSGVTLNTDGSVTVTAASPTALNTILNTMTYTTSLTASGSDTITVTVDDGNTTGIGGHKISASGSIQLNVIANDSPVLTLAGAQTFSNTSAQAITGIALTDSLTAATVTATLTATIGHLHVTAGGGGQAAITSGSNDSTSVSISGSKDLVNTALGTLTYTATTSGADTITVTVDDGNTTAFGGHQTATGTIAVTVYGGAAPGVTVPDSLTIGDLNAHSIPGISVASQTIGSTVGATVSAVSGHLHFDNGGGGATIGAGNGGGSVTITASSIADLNLALGTLVYTSTAVSPVASTDTITVSVDNGATTLPGGALTASGSFQVSLAIANDIPQITVPLTQSVSAPGYHAISGVSVSDHFSGSSLTANLTASSGLIDVTSNGGTAIITGNDSNNVTITGSLAAINTALASLRYQAGLTRNGTDGIVVSINDNGVDLSGGAQSNSGLVAVTITANDSPVIRTGDGLTVSTTAAQSVSGIAVVDNYDTGSVTATVAATAGTLSVTANGATVTHNASALVSISGTKDQVNAALASLTYTTTASTSGSDTITVTYTDGGASLIGGAKSATNATIGVTLLANTAPSLLLPDTQIISDTAQHAITGIILSDAISGSTVTATVTAQHGTLNFTGTGITGNDSGSVSISGSLAAVNTILGTLKYTSTATGTSTDSIAISVDDGGTSLIGGHQSISGAIAVNLIANDSPVIRVPSLQTITTSTATAISGLSVADGAIGGTVTATVSALSGHLAFTGSGVTNSGTTSVTITAASIDALNTILASLQYTATATTSAADTVTLSLPDGNSSGIGGAKTTANSFDIQIVANDRPVVTVPATQTISNTSAHTIDGISIADDNNANSVTATVTATGGTLTGDGMTGGGTSTVTITGIVSDVNAALATLAFTSTNNAIANSISVSVDDQYSDGIGGHKTASGVVALNLVANDTPNIGGADKLSISDSNAHAVTGLTVTDSAHGSGYSADITANGSLALTAGTGGATIGGTATHRTITATTLADVNAALATLTYTATASVSGDDTITVSVNDNGTALIEGAKTGSQSIGVHLIGNDAPELSVPARQTVTSAGPTTISGIAMSDDSTGGAVSATISVLHGTLGFTGSGVTGNNSASATVTAADPTALNAILATMTYTTSLTATGSDTVTVQLSDGGGSLIGGAKTASATLAIDVLANDAPVVKVGGDQQISDTLAHAIQGAAVTDGTTGATVTATLTAQRGTLTVTDTNAIGNGTGAVTLTASLAEVNAALSTLTYATTATTGGADTITVSVDDGGATLVGGAKTTTSRIAISLRGNDSPTIDGAKAQFYSDINAHAITGVAGHDLFGGATVTATLHDAAGRLDVGTSDASITGNHSTDVSITGSVAQVNTALAGLTYTATDAGNDTITVTFNDNNTTGIGGAKTTTAVIAVTVDGDAPVVNLPADLTIQDVSQHALSGGGVISAYSGTTVTAHVTAQYGSLHFTGEGISGNDSGSVTISGSLKAVNAILGTLKYTTTATGSATDTIAVAVNDGYTLAVGGDKTRVNSMTVTLVGNDLPVITVPGAQTYGDPGAHAITGLAIADSHGGDAMTATLAVTTGSLHVTAGETGQASITGGANNSTSLTLHGSRSQINTALATLTYTPGSYGSSTITLTANDGGASVGLIGGNRIANESFTTTVPAPDLPPPVIPVVTPVVVTPVVVTPVVVTPPVVTPPVVVPPVVTPPVVVPPVVKPVVVVPVVVAPVVPPVVAPVVVRVVPPPVIAPTVSAPSTTTVLAPSSLAGEQLSTVIRATTSAATESAAFQTTVLTPVSAPPTIASPSANSVSPIAAPLIAPSALVTPAAVAPTAPAAAEAGAPAPAPAAALSSAQAPAVMVVPAASQLTATSGDGGFRVPVISEAQRSSLGGDALIAVRPAAEVQVSANLVNFALPVDTFAHTRPDAVVQLTAAQADGQPLPNWLAFDPKTGSFNGSPPPDAQGTVEIQVVARDQTGREAVATVKIQLGERGASPVPVPVEQRGDIPPPAGKVIKLADSRHGRLGFTQQLRLAGRNAATLRTAALIARATRS